MAIILSKLITAPLNTVVCNMSVPSEKHPLKIVRAADYTNSTVEKKAGKNE